MKRAPPLLANECIEPEVVSGLVALGYDVAEAWNWTSIGACGRDDEDILDLGRRLERVVFTYDKQAKSFDADLDPGRGLIISRDTPPDLSRVPPYVDASLRAVGLDRIEGSLSIIHPGRVRFRRPGEDGEEIIVKNL